MGVRCKKTQCFVGINAGICIIVKTEEVVMKRLKKRLGVFLFELEYSEEKDKLVAYDTDKNILLVFGGLFVLALWVGLNH